MTRIVTYTYRPKRAPRKKATVGHGADHRHHCQQKRPAPQGYDDTEASPEIKAFFARMMRPPTSDAS